jgi:hypothetical protein
MQNANGIADLAKKIHEAGMLMDAGYFTQETGIPVTVQPAPVPFGNPVAMKRSTAVKVAALYNRHNHAH